MYDFGGENALDLEALRARRWLLVLWGFVCGDHSIGPLRDLKLVDSGPVGGESQCEWMPWLVETDLASAGQPDL